jgi:hypothetical protein
LANDGYTGQGDLQFICIFPRKIQENKYDDNLTSSPAHKGLAITASPLFTKLNKYFMNFSDVWENLPSMGNGCRFLFSGAKVRRKALRRNT